MASTLSDLISDKRLSRLFSSESRPCALQLWVLQVKTKQYIENRVVYGRLLPYSHSNKSWSFSDNDKQLKIGPIKVQVTKVSLYLHSSDCAELLRQLSAGQSIASISESLGFTCSEKLTKKFGSTILATNNVAYRPVAYLLNRDASYDRQSISSPHGAAGALSASITQLDKEMLFRLNGEYSTNLTIYLVEQLKMGTGLDFSGVDVTRFGDLELLVFPTLNDREQSLLRVEWLKTPCALSVRFNPMQVPFFDKFQFRLSITNGGQTVFSTIATANRDTDGVFEYVFLVSQDMREIVDGTALDIYGSLNNYSDESVLCCKWQIGYVREINVQGHVMGQGSSPIKFDWLERASRPAMSERVKAALTVSRDNLGFENQIGGRQSDAWVPANRELRSLFARFHPSKSEGQFFTRLSEGDGDGRLKFVEWFKGILAKYNQHQIAIFDPYFDDAGLGLILLCAKSNADYIVFRTLPKAILSGKPHRRKSDTSAQDGINNLIANCDQNRQLMKRIKFRIIGLKEGRLHDRYILIMGTDGLPIAGFSLSNSFQKAAENYPLLVTPIPADVLIQVEQYKSLLLDEARAAQSASETENSTMRLLFDSTISTAVTRHYEPLHFLEKSEAGNVLSVWVDEPKLRGLNGDSLKAQMYSLGLLKENSLVLTDKLQNYIRKQGGNFSDFAATWEFLGEVLAHSAIGDAVGQELGTEHDFLAFLSEFVEASFERTHVKTERDLVIVDVRLFGKSFEALLRSPYHTEHLFHATKYSALSWAEYFAIKFLWWHAPNILMTIAEKQISNLAADYVDKDAVRLSLLSQIVSEISLSIQFDINTTQRERLVQSSIGLLKWMGFNAVEQLLDKPDGLISVLLFLKSITHEDRLYVLGWMIHHAAMDSRKAEIYTGLVVALHDISSATISTKELEFMVDTLRGHMGELIWAEPWLFRDVIMPLINSERTTFDDACQIWMNELAFMLGPRGNNRSRLFNRAREGQTTNIASFLCANSSLKQRNVCLAC
jgi:hypothetical protein